MFSHKVKRQPKQTIEVTINIPWEDIQSVYVDTFSKLQKDLAVEGFRKGKVPKTIAEKHLTKESIYQELIKTLLPKIYEELLKKESLKPIMNPKIDLVKVKENEDWEVKFLIAEKPQVDLGDYKSKIKAVKDEQKKAEIWVPGKDKETKSDKKPEEERQKLLNEILTALLKEAKCEISDLIIEEELNHRLSHTLNEIQKLGLTVDNYLKSMNLTQDQLKERLKNEIVETYKLEFILSALADSENVKVEKDDLDKLFANIKDEKERQAAEANAYYYASILRKQKVLELLTSL